MRSRSSVLAAFAGLAFASVGCSDADPSSPSDAGATPADASSDSSAQPGEDAGTGPVNGCTEFVDRTDEAASRELAWDFAIEDDASRCMKIRVGQTVTWTGDLTVHPLGVSRVAREDVVLGDDRAEVTFATAGTYGYVCLSHSSMRGAILVE